MVEGVRNTCAPKVLGRNKMRTREEYNAYMRVYMKKYMEDHPEFAKHLKRKGAERRDAQKRFALTHYGKDGNLLCCWEKCRVSDLDMLSIDHKDDSGANHREKLTKGKHRTGGGINLGII
jgi:histone H3/H4